MKSLVLMITFLTRIPLKVTFEFDDKDFSKGLLWMPFIGIIIGLPLGLFSYYVKLNNVYLMSFLLIIIYISMTGGLHLDGLSDYFDGIFSGRTKERILEIMKDSHIGTFGVVGLCLYFVAFFALSINVQPMVIFMMPVVGRVMGLFICGIGKYPRETGMGQPLIQYGKWWHSLSYSVILLLILAAIGFEFLIAGSCVLLLILIFHLRTTLIIGGITGDVIGASIELSQIIWLLAFAVMGGL